jgi:hypothetical protein
MGRILDFNNFLLENSNLKIQMDEIIRMMKLALEFTETV